MDNIEVVLLRVKCKEEDCLNGKMDQVIKDNIKIIKNMEWEGINLNKENFIKAVGLMAQEVDKEF
jgi:hypothetical protein